MDNLTQKNNLSPMKYLIALFDNSQANLVRALEAKGWRAHRQVICRWNKDPSTIPAIWCRRLEIVSEGKVTREQLRPDIFG